jgi:hypothetical protein
MVPNPYLYEKALVERRQDLQREVERRRMLARLPRRYRGMSRQVARDLGVLLVKLGMWLKERGEVVESDL